MNRNPQKLMLLGGLRYLLPVIEAAHKLGLYVITCDYLPGNPAHRYADAYVNASILDKDAVLQAAREWRIDGIMSFAVDPGVVTAAYVQEQMGLPGNPYESVCILQNKDRFRAFLREHGFNAPWSFGFASAEEALARVEEFTWPAIVKPTDSAGSKGVSRVNTLAELPAALHHAFQHAHAGCVIVEEFLELQGNQSSSDCFSIDGELQFTSFSAQWFDLLAPNPYAPAAESWPSAFTPEHEQGFHAELQRLITLLGMRTSLYNVETRISANGTPYIMEVSPRGGGNRIAEMLRYATGVDLIIHAVRAAVGLPLAKLKPPRYQGHWLNIILHASQSGIFQGLRIAEPYRNKVVEQDLGVKPGDAIHAFCGANDAIGTCLLRLDSYEEVKTVMADPDAVFQILCQR